LRSDVDDAFKKFSGSSSDILTPNGNVLDGPAALTNNTQQVVPPTGVTAYNCLYKIEITTGMILVQIKCNDCKSDLWFGRKMKHKKEKSRD